MRQGHPISQFCSQRDGDSSWEILKSFECRKGMVLTRVNWLMHFYAKRWSQKLRILQRFNIKRNLTYTKLENLWLGYGNRKLERWKTYQSINESQRGGKEVVGLEFVYRKTHRWRGCLRGNKYRRYCLSPLFPFFYFFSKARLVVVKKSLRFARRGNDFIENHRWALIPGSPATIDRLRSRWVSRSSPSLHLSNFFERRKKKERKEKD